jgi:hypothetical protein
MEHDNKTSTHKKSLRVIRNVYLYLVSMIGLIVFIFGAVGIINNVFQNYIFRVDYDYYSDPFPQTGTCYMQYVDPTDREGKRFITPTPEQSAACEAKQEQQKEQNRRNRIGQEFSIAIAQMAVGLPIWLFHWGIIQKEYRRKEEEDKS